MPMALSFCFDIPQEYHAKRRAANIRKGLDSPPRPPVYWNSVTEFPTAADENAQSQFPCQPIGVDSMAAIC
jgi:hypothetical protein